MSDAPAERPEPTEPPEEPTPDDAPAALSATDPAARRGLFGRRGPASASFGLRDLLVVTYAVPAAALRPHLPDDLAPDVLPTPAGELVGFVQAVCAFHADARWSLLPEGAGQSFHQATLRVLVRREKRRGALLLRSLVGSDEAHRPQRAVNRDADYARFSVYIAGDPARSAYQRYSVRAVGDRTQIQLDVRVPAPDAPGAAENAAPPAPPFPFATPAEAAAFLVDRPDNYFRASAPRSGLGVLPWQYGDLPDALTGTVAAARLPYFTGDPLNLLSAPDAPLAPYSVLILPAVEVTAGAPRYARFK